MRRLVALWCGLAAFWGCASDPCDLAPQRDQCAYPVELDGETPAGIRVDAPVGYDLERLDRATAAVDACLGRLAGADRQLPGAVREAARCADRAIAVPIPRRCLRVRVAAGVPSCADPDQELLPGCPAPAHLCRAKGLEPTEGCPCLYRAGVQSGAIVTTPDLHLYADPLVRLVTGCSRPWESPELVRCMRRPTCA